jgi:hypothetical protein
MRKQLYLDIQTACKAIKNANGKKLFQHIDLWNQNVEFLEEDRHWNRPALFIEFKPIVWQTAGERVQEAVIDINLHIVTDWYGQTQEDSPKQSQGLDYLDIPDQVVAALHNLKLTLSGSLTRTQSIINHNHARYCDSIEVYQTHIRDNSAYIENDTVKKTSVSLQISTEE